MKLWKSTLLQVPYEDLKRLLEKYTHPNIVGTSDFIRWEVSTVLQWSGKQQTSTEQFQQISEKFDSFDPVTRYFRYGNKQVDISVIEFLSRVPLDNEFSENELGEIIIFSDEGVLWEIMSLCKTPENFRNLYIDTEISSALKDADLENITVLWQACKTPEDFISLCGEPWVREMFSGFEQRLEHLKIIVPICTNAQELKTILGHDNIFQLLDNGSEKKFIHFFQYFSISTSQELLSVLECKNLCDLISFKTPDFFQSLLDRLEISTLEELISLSEKEWIIDSHIWSNIDALDSIMMHFHISKWRALREFFYKHREILIILAKIKKVEILEFFISHFSIQKIDDFSIFCENENIVDILQYGSLENIKKLFIFYQIDTIDEFDLACKNIYFASMFSEEVPSEWLDKLIRICETPEYFSLLCTHEAIFYTLEHGFPESILWLIENNNVTKDDFFVFFKDIVSRSKDNARILLQNKIPYSPEFWEVFSYLLQNKKKSLVDFINKLSTCYEYDLGIEIENFLTFNKLKSTQNPEEIDFEKANGILGKMLDTLWLSQKQHDRFLRRFRAAQSTGDTDVIQTILADVSMIYFNRLYNKKWNIKLKRELNVSSDIPEKKLQRQEFIEAYKMSVSPDHNKWQIQKLLRDYLDGKFDDISLLNQYNTEKNQQWLADNLTQDQQKVWLAPSVKEIDVSWDNSNAAWAQNNSNTNNRIENHVAIAVQKIKEINTLGFSFKVDFSDSWELQKVYNMEIKKYEEDIKSKDTQNLFEDLKFQIDSIKSLKQQKGKVSSQKAQKVIIQRELDPMNSLMMWNWVEGSCLSFYSTVGNYWSSISNSVDVNKWVYYLRDEKWELLGRCIITLGQDKKVTRYKMYYAKNTSIDLELLFNEYTREMAEMMGLEINGNQYEVEDIEAEEWYKDGEVHI